MVQTKPFLRRDIFFYIHKGTKDASFYVSFGIFFFFPFLYVDEKTTERQTAQSLILTELQGQIQQQENLKRLCKIVTWAPESISVGFSQKRADSLPLANCLGSWNRMTSHYGNIINCSSIFYHRKMKPRLCKGSQQVSNLHYDVKPTANRK